MLDRSRGTFHVDKRKVRMEDAQTSESELIGVGLDLELVSIVDQVFNPGEREGCQFRPSLFLSLD
jgi:hypothetical protein